MSLYYDAATVLTADVREGSLKSRIYGNKLELKSKPPHVYALVSETAKYDHFLKEVIDNAAFLSHEPKLTPILSLLLVHDYLFSKNGIAASSSHPLRQAIERHKARVQAEFTKARLRRKCATVEDLKKNLLGEYPPSHSSQPRWVRINTLKTTLEEQIAETFGEYKTDLTVREVGESLASAKVLAMDKNIPGLLALPPEADLTKTQAYKDGKIILQDKASCFPAYLLMGEEDDRALIKDCLDSCAAPGNKTSHLAALLARANRAKHTIFACERDPQRSRTLMNMMAKSGADSVTVLAGKDFLTVNPHDPQYEKVTHLLLDPSCSGSGIIGREDVPSLALPLDRRAQRSPTGDVERHSKKRKRGEAEGQTGNAAEDVDLVEETKDIASDQTRLRKLSALQTKIVEHALSFPAARRVTYSTCSVHVEENEAVVSRILASNHAKTQGWRVLRREEQPAGLREWKHRGGSTPETTASGMAFETPPLSRQDLEACIRCHPGHDEGTMGFFLCGFVRSASHEIQYSDDTTESDDGWEGFSD
ncbi:uncharacterized protein Z518_02499 [Rhinocladiella mackenziei CBS 650.93]|uniref:SAM-dependent MTase RsmB/NOP-type domain-containing protein n=1 Tax=Rhinocladiella mackenziei CBS 650.93 TaxID=1442369 RepID=A0A0D2JF53_9EURO|nr:uncharacterized protein Z518_02499 [Rhinocladiella mackenziei CBS 650.93]KIX07845.1 hypothetical protein Z518_02499 [Rhinocladiella mackenziei CBS 650.93]